MGWTGSDSTQSQVKLTFVTKDEAAAYAEKHGIIYTLIESQRRKQIIRKNGYGENFATNRKTSWTH
jgi:NADH dehydrogenase